MANAKPPQPADNKLGKHYQGIQIIGKAAGEAQREKTRRIVRGALDGTKEKAHNGGNRVGFVNQESEKLKWHWQKSINSPQKRQHPK